MKVTDQFKIWLDHLRQVIDQLPEPEASPNPLKIVERIQALQIITGRLEEIVEKQVLSISRIPETDLEWLALMAELPHRQTRPSGDESPPEGRE